MNPVQILNLLYAAFTYTFDSSYEDQKMFTGNITKSFDDTERNFVIFMIALMKDMPKEKVMKLISEYRKETINCANSITMNIKCKCGGRFYRCDLQLKIIDGFQCLIDNNDKVAKWMCNKCSAVRQQRKRQKNK